MVAASCVTEPGPSLRDESACFMVGRIESSRIVTEIVAPCTTEPAPTPARSHSEVAGDETRTRVERAEAPPGAPTSSEDALKLAISLAVQSGDLDTASVLLEVAKRTRRRTVTPLEVVRRRDDGEGTG
jgi:hypothetical protein